MTLSACPHCYTPLPDFSITVCPYCSREIDIIQTLEELELPEESMQGRVMLPEAPPDAVYPDLENTDPSMFDEVYGEEESEGWGQSESMTMLAPPFPQSHQESHLGPAFTNAWGDAQQLTAQETTQDEDFDSTCLPQADASHQPARHPSYSPDSTYLPPTSSHRRYGNQNAPIQASYESPAHSEEHYISDSAEHPSLELMRYGLDEFDLKSTNSAATEDMEGFVPNAYGSSSEYTGHHPQNPHASQTPAEDSSQDYDPTFLNPPPPEAIAPDYYDAHHASAHQGHYDAHQHQDPQYQGHYDAHQGHYDAHQGHYDAHQHHDPQYQEHYDAPQHQEEPLPPPPPPPPTPNKVRLRVNAEPNAEHTMEAAQSKQKVAETENKEVNKKKSKRKKSKKKKSKRKKPAAPTIPMDLGSLGPNTAPNTKPNTKSTQAPPKESQGGHNFAWLWLLLFLFLAAGTAYFLYQTFQTPQPQKSLAPSPLPPLDAPKGGGL